MNALRISTGIELRVAREIRGADREELVSTSYISIPDSLSIASVCSPTAGIASILTSIPSAEPAGFRAGIRPLLLSSGSWLSIADGSIDQPCLLPLHSRFLRCPGLHRPRNC